MENKMREYLGKEYSESNHLLNWMKYWSKGTSNYSDKWRLSNDLDCLYLGCLEADTIISIWQISMMVYNTINPSKDFKLTKSPTLIKKIFIDEEGGLEKYFPSENELVKKLQELAQLAETRANVMMLPNRKMQCRGAWYADQIPATLYQCFQGGKFSEYFTKNEELEKWIKEEHLEAAFKNQNIQIDNIIPIAEGFSANCCIKGTKKENLISSVLDYSIDFLKWRTQYYG